MLCLPYSTTRMLLVINKYIWGNNSIYSFMRTHPDFHLLTFSQNELLRSNIYKYSSRFLNIYSIRPNFCVAKNHLIKGKMNTKVKLLLIIEICHSFFNGLKRKTSHIKWVRGSTKIGTSHFNKSNFTTWKHAYHKTKLPQWLNYKKDSYLMKKYSYNQGNLESYRVVLRPGIDVLSSKIPYVQQQWKPTDNRARKKLSRKFTDSFRY